ncbi:MAG TPA: sulfurtransferase-like selenium metabolism protein YedF [Planctomycetes bacterium]|jgi:hypothetical protein|nr:sulfurtransferase-like selenium metabolism protein YedF [Planctomycetota bacterium]HIL36011.1 sulfurtransferase-like selenium metabolism protein YedF [Planctomycetota bacterium]
MKTIILLNQDQMGHGDQTLGQKILGTFLRKIIVIQDLDAILFYNTGTRLLDRSSALLGELSALEERGVELLPCGTCVEALGVDLAVGRLSDMDTIVRELERAEKVITL